MSLPQSGPNSRAQDVRALGALRTRVREYAYPVSSVFARYYAISAESLQDRHSALGDCFEALVRFVAVVALKDAGRDKAVVNSAFPEGLDFLRRPAMGHWVSVVRSLAKAQPSSQSEWLPAISAWFHAKVDRGIRAAISSVPELDTDQPVSNVGDVLNLLVTYRNKVRGHGARLPESALRARLEPLELLVAEVTKSAGFLADMNAFCVVDVKVIEKGAMYQIGAISLRGTDRIHRSYRWSDALEPNDIYVTTADREDLPTAPLSLSPFSEWQSVDGREPQFYFFNDAQRTKLEYLCYVDGTKYAHRELKAQFREFLRIDLDTSARAQAYLLSNYTPEERAGFAQSLLLKSQELLSQQKFEAAVVALEEALDWSPSADTYALMAEALIALGESSEYVVRMIDSGLELAPDHVKCRELRSHTLRSESGADIVPGTLKAIDNNKRTLIDDEPTDLLLFDAIMPSSLAGRGTMVWGVVAVAIYVALPIAALPLLGGRALRLLAVGSVFLGEVATLLIALVLSRRRFLESYYPLLSQVESTRTEDFRLFFVEQYRKMFGHFVRTNGKVRIDLRKERRFVWISTVAVLAFVLCVPQAQQLLLIAPAEAVIQWIFTTFLWIVIVPSARFIIVSTIFMRDYGNLSLSPIVSSSGDSGYDRILSVFFNNLLIVNVIWLLNWCWNLLLVRDPLYSDFLGMLVGAIVLIFWAVFTPLHMRRALRLARSLEQVSYRGHVRQAFKAFVKMPTESTRDRVRWLLEHESLLAKVSRTILGPRRILAIFVGGAGLAAISAVYIAMRLGWHAEWLARLG